MLKKYKNEIYEVAKACYLTEKELIEIITNANIIIHNITKTQFTIKAVQAVMRHDSEY